jgi:hypothetical protein
MCPDQQWDGAHACRRFAPNDLPIPLHTYSPKHN